MSRQEVLEPFSGVSLKWEMGYFDVQPSLFGHHCIIDFTCVNGRCISQNDPSPCINGYLDRMMFVFM